MLSNVGHYKVGDETKSIFDDVHPSVVNIIMEDESKMFQVSCLPSPYTISATTLEAYKSHLASLSVAPDLVDKIGSSNRDGNVSLVIGTSEDGFTLSIGEFKLNETDPRLMIDAKLHLAHSRYLRLAEAFNGWITTVITANPSVAQQISDGDSLGLKESLVAALNRAGIPAFVKNLQNDFASDQAAYEQFWADNVYTATSMTGKNPSIVWTIPRSYFFGHVIAISVKTWAMYEWNGVTNALKGWWAAPSVVSPPFGALLAVTPSAQVLNTFPVWSFKVVDLDSVSFDSQSFYPKSNQVKGFLATRNQNFLEYLLSFESTREKEMRASLLEWLKQNNIGATTFLGTALTDKFALLHGLYVISKNKYPVFRNTMSEMIKFTSTEDSPSSFIDATGNVELMHVKKVEAMVKLKLVVDYLSNVPTETDIMTKMNNFILAHPNARVYGFIKSDPVIPIGHKVLEETTFYKTAIEQGVDVYAQKIGDVTVKTMSNKVNALAGVKRTLAFVHPMRELSALDSDQLAATWSIDNSDLIETRATGVLRHKLSEADTIHLLQDVLMYKSVTIVSESGATESELARVYLNSLSFNDFREKNFSVENIEAEDTFTFDVNKLAPFGLWDGIDFFSPDKGKRYLFIMGANSNSDLENIIASQLLWLY